MYQNMPITSTTTTTTNTTQTTPQSSTVKNKITYTNNSKNSNSFSRQAPTAIDIVHTNSDPAHEIEEISKKISEHAEVLYRTWKSRGLAPTELLEFYANAAVTTSSIPTTTTTTTTTTPLKKSYKKQEVLDADILAATNDFLASVTNSGKIDAATTEGLQQLVNTFVLKDKEQRGVNNMIGKTNTTASTMGTGPGTSGVKVTKSITKSIKPIKSAILLKEEETPTKNVAVLKKTIKPSSIVAPMITTNTTTTTITPTIKATTKIKQPEEEKLLTTSTATKVITKKLEKGANGGTSKIKQRSLGMNGAKTKTTTTNTITPKSVEINLNTHINEIQHLSDYQNDNLLKIKELLQDQTAVLATTATTTTTTIVTTTTAPATVTLKSTISNSNEKQHKKKLNSVGGDGSSSDGIVVVVVNNEQAKDVVDKNSDQSAINNNLSGICVSTDGKSSVNAKATTGGTKIKASKINKLSKINQMDDANQTNSNNSNSKPKSKINKTTTKSAVGATTTTATAIATTITNVLTTSAASVVSGAEISQSLDATSTAKEINGICSSDVSVISDSSRNNATTKSRTKNTTTTTAATTNKPTDIETTGNFNKEQQVKEKLTKNQINNNNNNNNNNNKELVNTDMALMRSSSTSNVPSGSAKSKTARSNSLTNGTEKNVTSRPFLTRGSVAERVLMFEKCPDVRNSFLNIKRPDPADAPPKALLKVNIDTISRLN